MCLSYESVICDPHDHLTANGFHFNICCSPCQVLRPPPPHSQALASCKCVHICFSDRICTAVGAAAVLTPCTFTAHRTFQPSPNPNHTTPSHPTTPHHLHLHCCECCCSADALHLGAAKLGQTTTTNTTPPPDTLHTPQPTFCMTPHLYCCECCCTADASKPLQLGAAGLKQCIPHNSPTPTSHTQIHFTTCARACTAVRVDNHQQESTTHSCPTPTPPTSPQNTTCTRTCTAVGAAALLMPFTSTAEGSSATAYMGVATRQQGACDLQQQGAIEYIVAATGDIRKDQMFLTLRPLCKGSLGLYPLLDEHPPPPLCT